MVSQAILIGIAVGIFFAGLGIGYGVLQYTNTANSMMNDPQHMQKMMNDPQTMQQFHSMMMNDQQHMQKMINDPQHIQKMAEMMRSNPQAMNSLMNSMMSDPQIWNQWMGNMMNDTQLMTQWHQQMMQNPQVFNNWMNTMMMADPQTMQQWHNSMMNNPQFMNRWMGQIMNDPNFQQQYMGPWMMMKDPPFMLNRMNQYSQQTNLESSAVKTNIVSILADTWKYMATKAYSPSVIQVSSGTTVTWKNDDQIIHTVTDLGGEFDSGFIQPAETWQYTFDSNGFYYYYCSIHPWMEGAVIVS